MNLRRIYILLVAWCALVLLPGLLVAIGLFGDLGYHMMNLGGAVIAVWLVGYLAQIAIFMWIMRLLGEQKILAWFLMCMLPRAVDWTLPLSLSYVLFHNGMFMLGEVPSPGDTIPLLVDPVKPKRLKYDRMAAETHAATAHVRFIPLQLQ